MSSDESSDEPRVTDAARTDKSVFAHLAMPSLKVGRFLHIDALPETL